MNKNHNCLPKVHDSVIVTVGAEPRKKLLLIRIDAPLSRQPLVKGERLVRFEVSAAIVRIAIRHRLPFSPHPTPSLRRTPTSANLERFSLFFKLCCPKGRLRRSSGSAKLEQH